MPNRPRSARRGLACATVLLMSLTGCHGFLDSYFDIAAPADENDLYARLYPYYAEYCAVSQIRKRPGPGADTSGGWGGHAVFYLNGVCRVPDAGYPTIALCPNDGSAALRGVGLSVNAHFKNATWIATDGPDFFYHGNLAPGERLTRAAYDRTQDEAKRRGIYDGVVFYREVFDDMPAGMAPRDWMYEVSVATDYAINFGRDRYCARVPLSRAQMAAVVTYLNGVNAVYKDGKKDFRWSVLTDNCTHLAHNALAAAGIWDYWETDRFVLFAAFDFPVPKNEFVNLMRRTNDTDIADPREVYDDTAARRALTEHDRLPVEPGALATADQVVQDNDIYETQLRLIFYDDPTFGSYDRHFREIFSQPRYTDVAANLRYMRDRFRAASAQRAAQADATDGSEFAVFTRRFYDHLDREAAMIDAQLSEIAAPPTAVTRRP
jgi:hypothetical protein